MFYQGEIMTRLECVWDEQTGVIRSMFKAHGGLYVVVKTFLTQPQFMSMTVMTYDYAMVRSRWNTTERVPSAMARVCFKSAETFVRETLNKLNTIKDEL